MSDDSALTVQTVARKVTKKLLFANSRYVTRGAPRSGGLASVYQATDTDTGNTVALKVFQSGGYTDEVIEESFRREVQALSDLKHPNIVQILGAGRDEDNEAHYIVMEWVEQDLKSYCDSHKFADWADYFQSIGRGILEALIYAHSHSTAHRDIKPTNVLVTTEGQVKLCDFGISKIRNFLAPGVTLAQFASAPYAPPEHDDGSYSYSRDVFGFAALSAVLLSGEAASTHGDILEALEKASIAEPVRRVLRGCLSLNAPSTRPQNAVMLQAELERAVPVTATVPLPTALFVVTSRVRNIVESDMGLRGNFAERFLERDLIESKGEEIPPSADRPGRSIRIFGAKYGYIVVPDEMGGKLRIVDALEFAPSELERKRANACDLQVRLAVEGASIQASLDAIERMSERLLIFAGDQKQRRLEEKEQALYRTWLDLLSAKTELEKKRKARIQYLSYEVSGECLQFIPKSGAGATALLHQDVMIDAGSLGNFTGTVTSTSDAGIVIRPGERNKLDLSFVPEIGLIETDTTKSDVALDKQKFAVEAVRYGRSVNPDLGKLIVNPAEVQVPSAVEIEFLQEDIDEDKKEAVLTALAGPDLMVVEGPPGTGKTTFITELVLQMLRANPNARVLLTSQTHVALDNSLERIVRSSGGRVSAVRIGHESDERIADSTRKLLLDAKLAELRKTALASGRGFIEKWAQDNGLSLKETRRAMALERHAGLKDRLESVEGELQELAPKVSDDYRKTLDAEARAELDEQYQGLSKERGELVKALMESLQDLEAHIESKEELKEFSECSAVDLRGWAEAFAVGTPAGEQLKEMLLAHADWETRFGRSREFKTAVIASAQIVAGTCLGVMSVPGRNEIVYDLCIVDEASIATPTEVLVPMSRARRTVLVGDSKQLSPFQDPELQKSGLLKRFKLQLKDQKTTLFSHLSEGLPAELCKTLTTQHRMLPAIGNLVSECFYRSELRSVERMPASHLKGALPLPVTWYSTSQKPHHTSRTVGTSHYNDVEVEFIITLLGRINFRIQNGKGKDKRVSVAILTGYGEQRQRLQTAVETKRHAWSSYSEIFVNVVDAFQGREADIVLFSVTRSEAIGLGFLREMERINVALSRGKELLAIVGDHLYCQNVSDAVNPLKNVLDYIRRNPDTCKLEELS